MAKRKKYNPFIYWKNRENPNRNCCPTNAERAFLAPEISIADSILDVGPGVGRMFSLYRPEVPICGVDISETYKHKAKAKAMAHGLNYEHEVLLDFYKTGLPFERESFDLCIAVKVLLHVTPDQIDFIMSEMARVATKVMITSKIGDDPADHVFNHNYREIIERNNLCIIEGDIIGNQIHLIYYGY